MSTSVDVPEAVEATPGRRRRWPATLTIGTVLLAIALILGRPGYHGEDDRPRYPGAPTVYGQQNHPGIAQPGQYGDQPYGSYEQPRSFGSAGDPYGVPDDRGDVRP